MGQPVKIVDLAQHIIELSGLRPNVDIDVVFTGLRPGERLHEQLYMDGEETQPTTHGKIVMLSHPPLDSNRLTLSVADLESTLATREAEATLARLNDLVDAFAPSRRVSPDRVGDPRAARLREAYT
jgi:FlaA1/EpsC-like NDP-sugar epimerase